MDDWIETYTGRKIWIKDTTKNNYVIRDIAHALSLLCRFNGQCKRHYSVAQHSIYVSQLVPVEHRLVALLHDAAEAYIVDLPRPIKRLLPDYKTIEYNLQKSILEYFGLANSIPQCVKDKDTALLATEARQLMRSGGINWYLPQKPVDIKIEKWGIEKAEKEFLIHFYMYVKGLEK